MENKLEKSQTKIIASTNVFQIEFVEKLGKEDYPPLINISLHLAKEYGRQAVLTKNTIEKYFDGEKSLPFIARYQNEIIGYIIGIPLEELREDNWAVNDENFDMEFHCLVPSDRVEFSWTSTICKNVIEISGMFVCSSKCSM